MSRIWFLLALAMVFTSCYPITQGYYLFKDRAAAKPIQRLQKNNRVTAQENILFARAHDIRTYALENLGLQAGKNYTTYVSTEKDFLVTVVSAADSISFQRKEWWFPFFGTFPYKGFYKPKPAQDLADRLRKRGWDVFVRKVDGFSTLGIFRDPLYTFMLDYSEARLASLIIHEMAHATLWIKRHAQFNEEFATFVGKEGVRAYMVEQYGEDSPEVIELDMQRADRMQFEHDLAELHTMLQVLYTAYADNDKKRSKTEILKQKNAVIHAFQKEFKQHYAEKYNSETYDFLATMEINNAYVDLFQTYTSSLHVFEDFHHQHDGLAETISALLQLMDKRRTMKPQPAPIELLRNYVNKTL